MNRLKVWLFVLLAVAVGVGNVALESRAQVQRAIGDADASLSAAAAQLATALRLQASDAAAIAGLAARDAGLLQALYASAAPEGANGKRGRRAAAAPADGDADAQGAARQAQVERAAKTAVEGAAAALGREIPVGSWWAAASRDWIEKKLPGASDGPQKEAAAFLRDAASGTPRRGLARVNDGLWYGVAVPAGEGAALVLFLPLDLPWARALREATGVDVTIAAGLPKPITTARADDARAVQAAARPGAPASAGVLSAAALGARVLGLGPVPLLFASAPAARALAVPLERVPNARVVLSAPLAARLAPVAAGQANALVGVVLLLVAGAAVAFAVRPEGSAPVPDELVAAASRVASGDFTARAPTLAGRFGTLADGLNRAADAAQRAATANLYAAPTADAVAAAAPDAPAQPPADAGVVGGTFEAGVARTAAPWSALASAARAAPPVDGEEQHWQQIFDEFVRVRRQCGEPAEGLTYDRFRAKLAKNKEQLVQKYACRTVRFQVYVKEGKAALKATPVK